MREQVKAEPNRRRWHGQLTERAQRILDQPPSKYEIPDGLRLLSTSRRALDRVQTLALLYRLDGDKRNVERAWKELEAAADFPDWNPRHFLDTAEMTHAFAIGYDWLYDAWTVEQRATLRAAMIEKGLKPALASYRGTANYGWWMKSRHNWNQVCNGGIGVGALAIGDEEPALAGEILEAALKSIQLAMAEFAPDGAWSEGPGYWNYATSYNVVFLAALERALGTDFGLSGLPAFADTGLFPIYITGPLGRTFNYADGSDGTIRAPQMFWLAGTFERPAYLRYQRAIASAQPLDLLWYNPRLDQPSAEPLPLDKYFRSAEVVTMRSAWDDRDALFVAFKGATIRPITATSTSARSCWTRWACAGPSISARTTTICPVTSAANAGPITGCAPKATTCSSSIPVLNPIKIRRSLPRSRALSRRPIAPSLSRTSRRRMRSTRERWRAAWLC